MRVRPLHGVSLVSLLVVGFSGCFGLGGEKTTGEAFDALPTPVWRSGFSWTYDVTTSSRSSYVDEGRPEVDGEVDELQFTMMVVNDTQDIMGEPVYYTRSTGHLDHPAMQGTFQAVSKASLAVAAYGYNDHYPGTPPPATPVPHSGYYAQPADPCDGVTIMTTVPEQQRFPAFQFPLDDGLAWSGTWGEGDVPMFEYTARVRGMTPVQVPAGIFPSVYIEMEFVPVIPEEYEAYADDYPVDFKIRAESWYSPDVRYFTKSVLSAKASGGGDARGMSFEFISTMQLKSFSLAETPAEPVEVVLREQANAYAQRVPDFGTYRIVADQELPIELGAGPVTVNLGLERMDDYRAYDGRIATRASVPETAGIDHETHEVVWMVGRSGDYEWPWQEYSGDSLSLVLDEGGRYGIQAHIRPIKCGDHSRTYVEGQITTSYTTVLDQAMEPGLQRTLNLGSFLVEPEPTALTVEWSLSPSTAMKLDKGVPIVVSPTGQKKTMTSSPFTDSYVYPTGKWRIDWDTQGPTVGDDVRVQVKVVYDPYFEWW